MQNKSERLEAALELLRFKAARQMCEGKTTCVLDEHDVQEMVERVVAEGEWIFSSRLEVEYLNEKYELGLEEDDEYDTLAGFIIAHHGGIPHEGEELTVGGYKIRILRREQSRLDLVSLQRLDK